MKRFASVLIAAVGFLHGCGGGGGSANTGGQPPVTSYSLDASVSGLEGTLTLVANSEAPVSISSNSRATLARLASGTAYTVSIATQPTTQHCTLSASSGTLSADVTIAVSCASRITASKNTVGGFEVARFNVASLDLQPGEYSGSIDGTIGVTLAVDEEGLVVLMPPLADGAHRLEVLVDGVRYPVDFNVSTPALPLPAAQVTSGFVSEIESGLAALRSDPAFAGMSDWTSIDAEVAALKAQISTMSAADLDALARIISMNQHTAAAATFSKATHSPLQLKYNDAACLDIHRRVTSHLIDSVAYVSWTVALAAVGTEFGPYGAVAGVTAAGSMYVLKAWPAIKALKSTLKEYGTEQCFAFQRLDFDLQLEDRFMQLKAGRSSRSMAMTQQTLTFNHKRTRAYDVTGTGTLPEDIRESASLSSKLLKFASAFMSDDMKEFLQNWTATYTRPVDLSDFVLSGVTHPSIKGTLGVQNGMLRLRFEYLPEQMSNAPVDFTFTLSGNNQSWQIPARLNVIERPVAHADDVTTQTNEMLQGELQADFAESFRISLQPVNGTVALDAVSGAYQYTPNTDYTGADSFAFVAVNERGESAAAVVSITVSGLCTVDVSFNNVQRSCYTDIDRTTIDTQEWAWGPPGLLQVQRVKFVHVVPGDIDSIRNAQYYRYFIQDDSSHLELEKITWAMLPGTTVIVAQSDVRAYLMYASSGIPTSIRRDTTTNNLANLTGARETIICSDGKYTWTAASRRIDPVTGQAYEDSITRTEYDVPGACPITLAEAESILPPLPMEDIRAWQLWNEMQGD